MSRAIQELIFNCVDEDSDASVVLAGGMCTLTNKGDLSEDNFVYKPNEEKITSRLKYGKYGYGLKDAIAVLTAHQIRYEASSPQGSYVCEVDDKGDLLRIMIDENEVTESVVQKLTLAEQCKISEAEFEKFVASAKRRCIRFRDDIIKNSEKKEITYKNQTFGTVYLKKIDETWPGVSEIFVHGCSYPFRFSARCG